LKGAPCAASYFAKPNRGGGGVKDLAWGGVAPQKYNSGMARKEVIALIDAEIAILKQARALLAAGSAVRHLGTWLI